MAVYEDRCGPYPYPLKRRIASDSGHLSNDSSALEARTLVDSGTTRLVLGHLSKENNHPELARETVRSELTLAGMAGTICSVWRPAPNRDR